MTGVTIATVLLDADGVLQDPIERWRPAFGSTFALASDVLDSFVESIAAVDFAHLTRGDGFSNELSVVLHKWNLAERSDEVLRILNAIRVDMGMIEIVRDLRVRGIRCHLATNQQSHRAHHMSEVLGYRDLFEREFYSCQIGIAKPDIKYFRFVLSELDVAPSSVLFIDDREENVASAIEAGLQASLFPPAGGAAEMHAILASFGL
jgi:putative hydrolase of the HAD superfamily